MSLTTRNGTGNQRQRHRSINCLPNEILIQIFKFLNPKDLILNVSLVSHHWRNVALDPAVWQFQNIKDTDFQENLQILNLAPNLNTVDIITSLHPKRIYHALNHGKKDIKTLGIRFTDNSFNVRQICDLLLTFQNLKELDLQIPASALDKEICTALKTLRKLTTLRLTGVISDTQELIESIVQCEQLQNLDLSECRTVFRDHHLTLLLSSGRLWHSLHLVTHFVTDDGYNVIGRCQSLRDLALIKCRNLSPASLGQLANLTALRALSIKENCVLSAPALINLFSHRKMNHLVKVDFTIYRADDDVAVAIATNCVNLMHLRLAMCLLTDKGVRDIVLNAINLTHLDLEFNNIRGDSLHLIPKFLRNLTYLNLHLCYNVHINLLVLAQTLPNFTIVDPTGFPISSAEHGTNSIPTPYT